MKKKNPTLQDPQSDTLLVLSLSMCDVQNYLTHTKSRRLEQTNTTHPFPGVTVIKSWNPACCVQIRQTLEKQGCSVVGWYHSHPLCQPDPSLRDIDCQMHHQLSMKGPGGIYLPCVGLILCEFFTCHVSAEFPSCTLAVRLIFFFSIMLTTLPIYFLSCLQQFLFISFMFPTLLRVFF